MASHITARLKARCNLCNDDFLDARMLKCGHLFCSKCLVRYIKKNTDAETNQFSCFDCAKGHPAPDPVTVVKIQAIFPEPPRGPVKAGTYVTPRQTQPLCTVKGHAGQEVILFCQDHNTSICANCVVSKHKKCNNVTLLEAQNFQRKSLEKLAEAVDAYKAELQNAIKQSDRSSEELRKQAEQMKRDIKETVKQVVAKVEAEGRRLLQQVDDLLRDADGELKSAQSTQKETVETLESNIKLSLETPDPMESTTNLEAGLKRVSAKEVPVLTYVHKTEKQKQTGHLVGELLVDRQKVKPTQKPTQTSSPVDFTVKYEAYNVNGIAEVGDTLLVVQNGKSDIQVYSAKKKLLKTVDIPGLKSPFPGLVYLGTDTRGIQLVVGDYSGRALHFVTLSSDWSLVNHDKLQLEYDPWSVVLDKTSGQLVVCDKDNKSVHMYTATGDKQLVSCSWVHMNTVHLDKDAFSFPRCAIKQGDGFIVADYKKQQVIWVSSRGKVQRTYSGAAHQPLKNPCYLAVDIDTGHILIADYHVHCVHEVSEDGKWLRMLTQEEDGFQYPSCVYKAETGKLYIGHGDYRDVKIRCMDYRWPSAQKVNIMETKISTKLILHDLNN